MHVVHYGKYYPPYRGGVETVMESLCRNLAAAGIRVTALVANDGPATAETVLDGVRVIRMGRSRVIRSQPICPGLGRRLRELDADIVHVHLPNPLAALTCLRARPQGRLLALYHSDIVNQRLLKLPANWILRKFLARTDAIVVPTPRHIEFSEILPAFRDKCRVVHFGIDPEPYARAGAVPDGLLPPAFCGLPMALFVGRLVYYKGLEVLLRALQQTPGVALAVVGEGHLREETAALAARLGLAGRIAFLGAVSPADLAALYRVAAVLVLPSTHRSEMFGMVQLEAMAAGTPVVSTDLPSGVPYVNVDGETGLVVPPGAVEPLARAIRRLAFDPELACQLGAAGQRRVREHFHERQVAGQYLALYRELLGGSA